MSSEYINPSVKDFRYEIKGTSKIDIGTRIRSDSRAARIGDNINRDLRNSVTELRDRIDRILIEAINANIYRTRNGTDDIVLSGRLLSSQSVTVNGSSIDISYSVPYAALVHYGGYITPYGSENASRIYLPPRPWVTNVLSGNFSGYEITNIYRDIITRIISRYG